MQAMQRLVEEPVLLRLMLAQEATFGFRVQVLAALLGSDLCLHMLTAYPLLLVTPSNMIEAAWKELTSALHVKAPAAVAA